MTITAQILEELLIKAISEGYFRMNYLSNKNETIFLVNLNTTSFTFTISGTQLQILTKHLLANKSPVLDYMLKLANQNKTSINVSVYAHILRGGKIEDLSFN